MDALDSCSMPISRFFRRAGRGWTVGLAVLVLTAAACTSYSEETTEVVSEGAAPLWAGASWVVSGETTPPRPVVLAGAARVAAFAASYASYAAEAARLAAEAAYAARTAAASGDYEVAAADEAADEAARAADAADLAASLAEGYTDRAAGFHHTAVRLAADGYLAADSAAASDYGLIGFQGE